TLHQGIDNTSMPSFSLLPEAELDRLASYVIHLALRGEVEETALKAQLAQAKLAPEVIPPNDDNGDPLSPSKIEPYVQALLRDAVTEPGRWGKAAVADLYSPAAPSYGDAAAARDEAVSKGHTLFINKDQGGCLVCHLDYGRKALFRYDHWGTLV